MFIFVDDIYTAIYLWDNISRLLYLAFCESDVKQKKNITN